MDRSGGVRWTQMQNYLDIELAWGGYYASKESEDGLISVFRLLDLNRDAYHAALFKEKFSATPTLGELKTLSPFIGHAPIDTRALIRKKGLQFLGSTPLIRDDLEGYEYYLEAHGATPADIDELIVRILGYTIEPPIHLRLEIVDDELIISQIE
jgi:hypothetical protein